MSYLFREIKWVVYAIAVLLLAMTSVSAGVVPVVTGAAFAPSTGRTTITWQDATGTGLSYNIYRASSPINGGNLISARRIASRIPSGTGSFAFQVIDSGQSYYAVLPVNTSGVETKTFTVNLAGPISETDIVPPSAVQLAGTFSGMTVKLSWGPIDAKNQEDIVKWQVKRKVGTSGTPSVVAEYLVSYDPTGETSTVAVPVSGTFNYCVAAIDSSGNVSAQGNWIAASNKPDLSISAGTSVATNTDIAIAKAFPKKSQAVQITLTVRNSGAATSAGCSALISDGLGFSTTQAIPSIAAQGSANVTFSYTPTTAGLKPLSFNLDSAGTVTEINETNNTATVQIPVVTNDTYIMWYGDVTDLNYVNIPHTRVYNANEWKRRGAYAASFAGAVGSEAQLTQQYADLMNQGFNALAIDEVGYTNPGDPTPAWMNAITATKITFPSSFIAIWYMGSTLDSRVTQMVTSGKIDLIVYEVYITPPGANWQQTLQSYINAARSAGVSNRTIIGLGTSTAYSGGYTAAQHAAFVEQQIAYIRTNAPEMPGVAFFDAATLSGERALIDEICRQQFVK